MRVAYLVSQYPAASHTFIRREVAALRARDVEIHTFSIRPPSEGERADEPARGEYLATWYFFPVRASALARAHGRALASRPLRYVTTLVRALRHRVPGVRAGLWALFHFAEAIQLAMELDRRKIEHVHNHFGNSGANVGLLASHFLDIGWSFMLHGISEFDYPAGPILGQKIQAARFVACAHHFGRAQAMRVVEPGHWYKLVVVRCGVELDRLPVPESNAAAGGRVRVVCVGRLSAEKGHDGLLQAFSKVVAGGIDAELRLIGDGPDDAAIRARVHELGLGERVAMPGRASEQGVLDEIARADVFVSSSLMEGLPVVLMEALALRVPVIAPYVGGIAELVEHGETGLCYPAGDWAALEQALRRMLGDAELRERTAAAGRQRIEAEYDIQRAVAPLIDKFRGP